MKNYRKSFLLLLLMFAFLSSVAAQSTQKLFSQALAAYKVNNLEPAISMFSQVIAKDPKHAEAHFYLASCYVKYKKYEDAVPLFERAANLKTDYFDAHISHGKTLNLLNRNKEAEIVFKKAVNIKPNDSEGFLNLGIAQRSGRRCRKCGRIF